jgi:hypothetical protein
MNEGCRRISHSDGDYCSFVNDGLSRAENKSEARSNEMVGGAVISGSGAVASSQLGMI